MILRRGGRSYMRVLFTMNVAILKYHGCWAENKIGGTFNVTVTVILPAVWPAAKQYILKAQEPAIVKSQLIAKGKNSNCLPGCKTCIVLKSKIAGLKIGCLDKKGCRGKGVNGIAFRRYGACVVIVR